MWVHQRKQEKVRCCLPACPPACLLVGLPACLLTCLRAARCLRCCHSDAASCWSRSVDEGRDKGGGKRPWSALRGEWTTRASRMTA